MDELEGKWGYPLSSLLQERECWVGQHSSSRSSDTHSGTQKKSLLIQPDWDFLLPMVAVGTTGSISGVYNLSDATVE